MTFKLYKAARNDDGSVSVVRTDNGHEVNAKFSTMRAARDHAEDLNEEAAHHAEQERWETDQEVREMAYVMNGGPARDTAKHAAMAKLSIAELEGAGWDLLSEKTHLEPFEYIAVQEIVVRKGDIVHILRWQPFNRFWMRRVPSGGQCLIYPEELGLSPAVK